MEVSHECGMVTYEGKRCERVVGWIRSESREQRLGLALWAGLLASRIIERARPTCYLDRQLTAPTKEDNDAVLGMH